MYNLMDSNSLVFSVIYCCVLEILGSFFLLNVVLAVLTDALHKVDEAQL